jgi:tRNA(Ile)-lysidine synthetase-like protein
MIEAGDRIAVGVSGGKDSVTLLFALAKLRRYYPKPFEIVAVTLDAEFGGVEGDFSEIERLCHELEISYILKRTEIGNILFNIRQEKNPCSLCAKMRRGMLHDIAVENGCNKVALGHNLDDAAETFMMNLLNGSRIGCFSPVTYLSRKNLTMIRPLIYATENQTLATAKMEGLPIVKNPCPANGATERQHVKELLRSLDSEYHDVKNRIVTGMKTAHTDGW